MALLMTMAAWIVSVHVARMIVIVAMNFANEKTSCKSKGLKTDTAVTLASADVLIETVIPNVEIWSSESKPEAMDASRPVSAFAQIIVCQTATAASKQVSLQTISPILLNIIIKHLLVLIILLKTFRAVLGTSAETF